MIKHKVDGKNNQHRIITINHWDKLTVELDRERSENSHHFGFEHRN